MDGFYCYEVSRVLKAYWFWAPTYKERDPGTGQILDPYLCTLTLFLRIAAKFGTVTQLGRGKFIGIDHTISKGQLLTGKIFPPYCAPIPFDAQPPILARSSKDENVKICSRRSHPHPKRCSVCFRGTWQPFYRLSIDRRLSGFLPTAWSCAQPPTQGV